jgi:hypothetical protein
VCNTEIAPNRSSVSGGRLVRVRFRACSVDGEETVLDRLRAFLGQARSTYRWVRAGFTVPYPQYVKQAALLRHVVPGSVFVETGTYKGATSRYFRRKGFQVATIEVHQPLFDKYAPALRKLGVDSRLGDSTTVLPEILNDYAPEPSFTVFLDGHYSGGITGKGDADVPVIAEFDVLRSFALDHPDKDLVVIVDDVRLFMPDGDPKYPMKSSLIDFARSIEATWSFESDLFTCRRTGTRLE